MIEINEEVEKQLWLADRCGTPYRDKSRPCEKFFCSHCGGADGLLHKKRYESIMKRLEPRNITRYALFRFDVPERFRRQVMSKERLNGLIEAVRNLVKHEFGKLASSGGEVPVRYKFDSGVIAVSRLFDTGNSFNPHIDVLIVKEPHNAEIEINSERQSRIAGSYRKALQELTGENIGEVDISCYQQEGVQGIRAIVWSMTEPPNPNVCDRALCTCDIELSEFLLVELKGFRPVRQWGLK